MNNTMKREELDKIALQICKDYKSVQMTKRTFVNALGCEKRTTGNLTYINDWLKSHNLTTSPNYFEGGIDENMELGFAYKIKSNSFQIYYLHIDKYKNLENLDVNFYETDHFCCFIGLNGSGKSNVLEAISAIFFSLYHIATLKDGYKKYPCEFSYTIKYVLNGIFYDIRDGQLTGGKKISIEMLPKNVIMSYSGEDTRLWERYYKPVYERYCSRMTATQGFAPPFMFYVSKNEWSIALLALLYSEDVDVVSFVRSILESDECEISFEYNVANIKKWEGTVDVEALIEKLRENKKYSVKTFRALINEISFIDQASTLFYYLYKLSTESESQVIKKVNIVFANNGSVEDLSEGEKKMIIANTIIHILSTQDSLCLFDEPDSHLHVGRKEELEKIFNTDNRYSIITTHSPVFLRRIKDRNIRSLENGHIEDIEKLQQIKVLSGGIINYFAGTLLLNSNNPLVLVEGIGDVNYITKAMELLSANNEEYLNISWDFLFMGGAGENAKQFIDKLSPYINEQRKVVVVFDRDDSGAEAMKKLGFTGNRNDYKTYKRGNWYFLMLPKTEGYSETDFTIEDYFSLDYKKTIAKQKIDESGGFFKKLPKDLRQNVKDTLGNQIDTYSVDDMKGFSLLIDKITNILDGKEIDIEEITV